MKINRGDRREESKNKRPKEKVKERSKKGVIELTRNTAYIVFFIAERELIDKRKMDVTKIQEQLLTLSSVLTRAGYILRAGGEIRYSFYTSMANYGVYFIAQKVKKAKKQKRDSKEKLEQWSYGSHIVHKTISYSKKGEKIERTWEKEARPEGDRVEISRVLLHEKPTTNP